MVQFRTIKGGKDDSSVSAGNDEPQTESVKASGSSSGGEYVKIVGFSDKFIRERIGPLFPELVWTSANINPAPGTRPGPSKPFIRSFSSSSNKRMDTIMSDPPTREEIEAKFETVEARLETKLVTLSSKMDLMIEKFTHVQSDVRESKENSRLAFVAASGVKFTVIGMGVAFLVAVIAIMGFGFQIAEFMTNLVTSVAK